MITAARNTMQYSRAAERVRRAVARLVVTGLAATVGACNPPAATTVAPAPTQVGAVRTEAFLDTVQQRTFQWFWDTTDPRTGLTPDRWPTRTFSSVAARPAT